MRVVSRAILFTLWIISLAFPSWAMENHSDVLRDQYGRIIGGATVTVYVAGSSTLATIYSDNGTTAKSNPFLTDALTGKFNFYAANGVYDITYSYPGSTFDAAHTRRISLFDVNDFSGGDGGGDGGEAPAQGLDSNFDVEKEINGANSLANAMRVGDGATPMCHYTDATLGPLIRPCTDSNTRTYIWTNFTWCMFDVEASTCMWTFDPDASTPKDMYPITSGYRMRKTLVLTADAFYAHSGCTVTTDTAFRTGGLIEPYIVCGDNDAHGFYRSFPIKDAYDGGTFTATVYLINVNATPANDYALDISIDCVAVSEVVATTISSTGEARALFDFDNLGTCTTACDQFDLAAVTTSAITPNGTCAGGNLMRVQALVDATATTTAQVADVKIHSIKLEWTDSSLSD